MTLFKEFKQYYNTLDVYKKAFWIYLILLFVEGSMRKWFMPGQSYLWMMCRDPIVIWTVLALMGKKRYLSSQVAKAFMIIGCITLYTTLFFGHQNVSVALYGFRIWFFHIPYIFIMANLLNREDLQRICRFLIFVFIPMTVLYVIQWASPPNTIINARVGGVIMNSEEIAYGAVRPSGLFGMGIGAAYYNPIVVAMFAALLISGYYRIYFLRTSKLFSFFAVMVVLMLITSVSRSTIVQSCSTVFFIAIIGSFYSSSKELWKIAGAALLLFFVFNFMSDISINGKNLLDPVTSRFKAASEVEGGASGIFESRILEPYKFWNDKGRLLNPPIFGYGIGAGSNYGTQTLGRISIFGNSNAWGLGEWSSQIVTNEMGFFFGTIVYLLRVGWSLFLFPKCVRCLKRNNDILPISLWTLALQYFANGNINLVMTLGWIVVAMILLLTSIKTSEKVLV